VIWCAEIGHLITEFFNRICRMRFRAGVTR